MVVQCPQNWTLEDCQRVMWSAESPFSLFSKTERVFLWRAPSEAYDVDRLRPTVKHGLGRYIIVFGSPLPPVTSQQQCIENSWSTQACKLYFETGMLYSRMIMFPFTPLALFKSRFPWDEVQHLPWPSQSPDLNIIEPLWAVLETRIRRRFPPPSSLPELEAVLHEEWLQILLTIIQDLYQSIPSRIQAELRAKGGPTPY